MNNIIYKLTEIIENHYRYLLTEEYYYDQLLDIIDGAYTTYSYKNGRGIIYLENEEQYEKDRRICEKKLKKIERRIRIYKTIFKNI